MRAPFLPGWRPDPRGADAPSLDVSGHGQPGARADALPPRRFWLIVVGLAAAASIGWVPFLGRAMSPDEGGFLVLASQWSPGASLYGDYWVDRPPGLVALFGLADWLGGPWALRCLGLLCVVVVVVLAGVIGRMATGSPRAGLVPAATAAVFVATPLLGGSVVNGELLGIPFVIAGIAAAIASFRATEKAPASAWAVAAGAAGAAAFLVKQNLADVFVVIGAIVVLQWGPAALRLLAGALGGALLTTAAALLAARSRGTGAGDLWDAVITFRGEASAVIAESATATTAGRLGGLLLALVVSGVPVVAVFLTWVARRRPEVGPVDLRWPAYALLAWEGFAVLAGGSYWLHYLMGLVPGLVVLAAAAAQRRPDLRTFTTAYAAAAISALAAIGWVAVDPIDRPEAPAIAYLVDHVEPGDTGVVAFGGANILEAAGLESPYPFLWSLPVRVRDPELEQLADVLAGPRAPTWLVVSGPTLGSWGISGDAAEQHVRDRYTLAEDTGRFDIYRLNEGS